MPEVVNGVNRMEDMAAKTDLPCQCQHLAPPHLNSDGIRSELGLARGIRGDGVGIRAIAAGCRHAHDADQQERQHHFNSEGTRSDSGKGEKGIKS